ncbi:hypothetical protein [Leucobacter chromiiresistens]|uniref:hypothetical protein n=1 Tax=Leucobacter chromiiresistens TaxID=1079994 RepID=UPI00128F6294|nr:hypothetical protein [Leucobacter chromiiresistens]
MALIITIVFATRGWKRDSDEREAAAQAEFFQILIRTIRSQGLPATRSSEEGECIAEAASLNAHAVAILISSKRGREMMDMLVRATQDATELGTQSRRYLAAIKSGKESTKRALEPVAVQKLAASIPSLEGFRSLRLLGDGFRLLLNRADLFSCEVPLRGMDRHKLIIVKALEPTQSSGCTLCDCISSRILRRPLRPAIHRA